MHDHPLPSQGRGPGGEVGRINPLAWVCWLAGVAAIPLTSRNPLYLTLDLLVVLVVYLSLPRRTGAARAWRLFATVGAMLAVLSIGFNVLTVHVGDRVFARLPDELPIVGGKLTWNALVYGVLSALAISTLLIGAATFNTAVRQGDLIRLMPARFAGLGIAGSIAMTMVPQTITAARDIYDAQRGRGHRFRGLRDARSLVVPLFGVSLERALVLSEALEARGFGASAVPETSRRSSGIEFVASALLLLVALALLGFGRLPLGLMALALAVVVTLAAGPRRGRSRFRPLEWNRASLAVGLAALACPLTLAILTALTATTLAYDTFPRLVAPPFDPVAGTAVLLLLAPIFWTQS